MLSKMRLKLKKGIAEVNVFAIRYDVIEIITVSTGHNMCTKHNINTLIVLHRLRRNGRVANLMCVCPCIVAYAQRRKTNQMPLNVLLHLKYAEHVSGTSMPIIRSSKPYVLLPPMVCSAWLLVVGGQEQAAGYVSLFLDAQPAARHLTPDNQQPCTAHHRR